MRTYTALNLALIVSSVAARPRGRQAKAAANTCAGNNAATQQVLGAAYFATNDPVKGNAIVAMPIAADGTLSMGSVTPTGGLGGVGVADNSSEPHPDALFTQDSIVVRQNALFAVNAGSNSLSMFKINAKDPTKLTLVATAGTSGDFPVAVAVNEDCSMACALNGGKNNGVACFAVSNTGMAAMGELVPTGAKQTTPPNGPGGSVSDILFDNNSNLLVSVKGTGPDAPGFLGKMSVKDGALGALNKNTPTGGAITFSANIMPANFGNGNIAFTTDPAVGAVTFDLGSENATSVPTTIEGQGATCWADYSAVTNTMFTTDIVTSKITEIEIDPQTLAGKVVKQTELGEKFASTDVRVAATKAGDFLYVLGAGELSVAAMAIAKDGQSKIIQTFKVGEAMATKSKAKLTPAMMGLATFVIPN